MKILAIDTATEACSVALANHDSIEEIFEVIPRKHTERVLPMVDELLNNAGLSLAELDAIAFDRGPGSFTGVRVGTSVAQGLAFSVDLPVLPISSLSALAQYALKEKNLSHVLSMIDARMNEVYWACYSQQDAVMVLQGNETVSPVSNIELDKGSWHCIGSGCDTYRDELMANSSVEISGYIDDCLPRARYIAELATKQYSEQSLLKAEQALPSYVRDEVTWKKISEQ